MLGKVKKEFLKKSLKLYNRLYEIAINMFKNDTAMISSTLYMYKNQYYMCFSIYVNYEELYIFKFENNEFVKIESIKLIYDLEDVFKEYTEDDVIIRIDKKDFIKIKDDSFNLMKNINERILNFDAWRNI
jgi:CRISPR/Cas system CSM-associated protein Csm4 (group 5 of RAMP superfamily)